MANIVFWRELGAADGRAGRLKGLARWRPGVDADRQARTAAGVK
jgi:hypothetical protein